MTQPQGYVQVAVYPPMRTPAPVPTPHLPTSAAMPLPEWDTEEESKDDVSEVEPRGVPLAPGRPDLPETSWREEPNPTRDQALQNAQRQIAELQARRRSSLRFRQNTSLGYTVPGSCWFREVPDNCPGLASLA
jgi:hypothetical protein